MHWVYVLQCEDGHVYVGQTQRLFSRFMDHVSKKVLNTGVYRPYALIGLYRVGSNVSFMEYHQAIQNSKNEYHPSMLSDWEEDNKPYYMVENLITERYMYEKKEDWWKVRGGKYTKVMDNIEEICLPWSKQRYYKKLSKKVILDRPLCHCGYPCEVIKTKKNNIMFKCPLNVQKDTWLNESISLHIPDPCNYFEMYTGDAIKKQKYLAKEALYNEYLQEDWVDHIPTMPKRHCYEQPYACLKCKQKKYFAVYAYSHYRQICKNCFIKHHDSIKSAFLERPKYEFIEEENSE